MFSADFLILIPNAEGKTSTQPSSIYSELQFESKTGINQNL